MIQFDDCATIFHMGGENQGVFLPLAKWCLGTDLGAKELIPGFYQHILVETTQKKKRPLEHPFEDVFPILKMVIFQCHSLVFKGVILKKTRSETPH